MQLCAKVKSDVTYYFPIPFQNDRYSVAYQGTSRKSPICVIEKTPTHIRLQYKGKPRIFIFYGE